MEIILLEDIEKVGEKHEIVTVKDGYGRNYLIPKKLGLIANASNRRRLDDLKQQASSKESRLLDELKVIAEKINNATITIGAKTGTSGKIFGSITNVQISNALRDQLGVDVERKKIEVPEEAKEVGTFQAIVNLHKTIACTINFEVVSE